MEVTLQVSLIICAVVAVVSIGFYLAGYSNGKDEGKFLADRHWVEKLGLVKQKHQLPEELLSDKAAVGIVGEEDYEYSEPEIFIKEVTFGDGRIEYWPYTEWDAVHPFRHTAYKARKRLADPDGDVLTGYSNEQARRQVENWLVRLRARRMKFSHTYPFTEL